jgi:hypothetical protein
LYPLCHVALFFASDDLLTSLIKEVTNCPVVVSDLSSDIDPLGDLSAARVVLLRCSNRNAFVMSCSVAEEGGRTTVVRVKLPYDANAIFGMYPMIFQENNPMAPMRTEDFCKQTPQCSICSKPLSKIRACSKCRCVMYCGRDCQKKHWPKHKTECSNTALPRLQDL